MQGYVYLGTKNHIKDHYLNCAKKGTYYIYEVNVDGLKIKNDLPGEQFRTTEYIEPKRIKLIDIIENNPEKHPREEEYLNWYNEFKKQKTSKKTNWYRMAISDAMFDITTTDIPNYDNMLQNPEYFRKNKGKIFEIVYMSPDEYISKITHGFYQKESTKKYYKTIQNFQTYMDEHRLDQERIKEYLKSQRKFPMPVIEYKDGQMMDQEGHHRATVAKLKGISQIPVMIVNNVNIEENGENEDLKI